MKRQIIKRWKRTMAVLLAFALVIPVLPAVVPRAEASSPDRAATSAARSEAYALLGDLNELLNRIQEARQIIEDLRNQQTFTIQAHASLEEGVFYTFSHNYEAEIEELSEALEYLSDRWPQIFGGIQFSAGYQVNSPDDLFYMDGNALKAFGEPDADDYAVKVSYRLYLSVAGFGGGVASLGGGFGFPSLPGLPGFSGFDYDFTLGTITVDVLIDPNLTGIEITEEPDLVDYGVGEALDLEGLIVTAQYSNAPDHILDADDYETDPAEDYVFDYDDISEALEVLVSYGGFTASFAITVSAEILTIDFNPNGGTPAEIDSVTVYDGQSITLPSVTRAGYTFSGWYDEYEEDVRIGSAGQSIIPQWSLDLIARWTVISSGGGGGGGGGTAPPPEIEIPDEEVPLAGGLTLMSLDAIPEGMVYYLDEAGQTVFVPFSLKIEDKLYFFGLPGMDYAVKPNPKQFGDIAGHWGADSILAIAAREIYQGYPDGSFRPDGAMTRAMFVSVLARLALADLDAYGGRVFDDVDPDAWYGAATAWAQDKGIVFGVGGGRFAPDAEVTRQEIAVMLLRFIEHQKLELAAAEADAFADLDEADAWAADAIRDAQQYGLISGKQDNRFDPLANSTRAEVASMLYRLIEAAVVYAQQAGELQAAS